MSTSARWLIPLLIAALVPGSAIGAANMKGRAGERSQGVPELPRILSAQVVLGTKYGTAVRVSYCFRLLSTDAYRGPWRLHLTVDNMKDGNPPLSIGWEVPKRCGTIVHPVGGIQQPYVLRYFVASRFDTRSGERQIRLEELAELNRRPSLPSTLNARVVPGATGKVIRISYCFRSLPNDRSRRPSRLPMTIVSARDPLHARGYDTLVTKRCDSVSFTYPVPGVAPPYVLRYMVVSRNGTHSKRAQVTVR
jgi:hypothetical protein